MEDELTQKIEGVAASCLQSYEDFTGQTLTISKETLLKVDGIIQEMWGGQAPNMLDHMVTLWGGLVGECIRAEHGGSWYQDEKLGVVLQIAETDIKIFPFNKVRKRFVNGEDDSIAFYYQFIASEIAKRAAGDEQE